MRHRTAIVVLASHGMLSLALKLVGEAAVLEIKKAKEEKKLRDRTEYLIQNYHLQKTEDMIVPLVSITPSTEPLYLPEFYSYQALVCTRAMCTSYSYRTYRIRPPPTKRWLFIYSV